ncbi:MAG TPA: hypothetical protein PLN69_06960 [bacterium]|nr:hypothetical protein [bacterium]
MNIILKQSRIAFPEGVIKTIGTMSVDDLENLIEQKIVEVFDDPDAGLELREDFKEKLTKRLSSNSRRMSHSEAVKKLG